MHYISTRDAQAEPVDFDAMAIGGLASNGGLFQPAETIQFDDAQLTRLAQGSSYQDYVDFAVAVLEPFIGTMSTAEITDLCSNSWSRFDSTQPYQLQQLDSQQYILELFHGPTLAFKDVGMGFLAQIFQAILTKRQLKRTIVVATSGDTGASAVDSMARLDRVNTIALLPSRMVSEVQQRQMTTAGGNSQILAVEGPFDTCQSMVKAVLNDPKYAGKLLTVNSINFARILAQMVYYAHLSYKLAGANPLEISIPSGNFGNAYACWLARRCGAPIDRIVVACNANDMLTQIFEKHIMQHGQQVKRTWSNAMDIAIPSNLERLLYDCLPDPSFINSLMHEKDSGAGYTDLPKDLTSKLNCFQSVSIDDDATYQYMKLLRQKYNYTADPHTAVAFGAQAELSESSSKSGNHIKVAVSTAHLAKFPDIADRAGIDYTVPETVSALYGKEEQLVEIEPDVRVLRSYIDKRA